MCGHPLEVTQKWKRERAENTKSLSDSLCESGLWPFLKRRWTAFMASAPARVDRREAAPAGTFFPPAKKLKPRLFLSWTVWRFSSVGSGVAP